MKVFQEVISQAHTAPAVSSSRTRKTFQDSWIIEKLMILLCLPRLHPNKKILPNIPNLLHYFNLTILLRRHRLCEMSLIPPPPIALINDMYVLPQLYECILHMLLSTSTCNVHINSKSFLCFKLVL